VGSASTALQALESVAAAQPMGVSELARRLGVSKPAAQRALQSLAESGWIRRSDDQPGRWVLTVKVVAVAAEVGSEFGLREVARPAMRTLVDATGEAVHISVLDGLDVVTIDQVDSTQVLRIHWSTGARSRAYAAASGKAMLAVMPADERNRHLPAELDGITTHTITSRDAFDRELDEIAARGYALQRGELRDDVASVAAPILARPGHPVAAISVFMPAHRFPEGGDARLGALVAEAAAKISAGLAIRS
jgi:IclR family transcriptional regulator, acetate operon repressor